jgi:hypothetical protein
MGKGTDGTVADWERDGFPGILVEAVGAPDIEESSVGDERSLVCTDQ